MEGRTARPGTPTDPESAPPLRLAGESATISLNLQPTPKNASLIVTPDRRHSSLVRNWRHGDVPLCRLCPLGTCVAKEDSCHMMIPGAIPPDQAALWSTVGAPRVVGIPRHD